MTSVIKRSLFVGISLALAALTARRLMKETEIEGTLDKSIPPSPPTTGSEETHHGESARVVPIAPPRPVPPTVTFSGKVVRNGPSLALRETAGVLYPLDAAGRADRFEGEHVRVTGKLDLDTRLIYVDAIESNVA